MAATVIFAIYKRISDTCGNDKLNLFKYVESNSRTEVEQKYPKGFMCGYEIVEIKPEKI